MADSTRFGQSGVRITVAPGTYRISAASSSITVPSNVELDIMGGANIETTGTTTGFYVFTVDGSTATKSNVAFTGRGRILVRGGEQGGILAAGQINGLDIGPITVEHASESASSWSGIVMRGDVGNGITNMRCSATLKGWAYNNNGDTDAGILVDQMVSGDFDVNVQRCLYGMKLKFTDFRAQRVLDYNPTANSWTTQPGVFDGQWSSASETEQFSIPISGTSGGAIAVAFSQPVQTMMVFVGIQSSGEYPLTQSATGVTTQLKGLRLDTLSSDGTWYRQKVVINETYSTAVIAAGAGPFGVSGEIVWGQPRSSELGARILDSGDSSASAWYWYRLSIIDRTTGDATSLSSCRYAEIIGARMPHDITIRGQFYDIRKAGIHMRTAHRVKTEITANRIGTHAINYNSDETTSLSTSPAGKSTNGRYFKSRWLHDNSVLFDTADTMFLARGTHGAVLNGVYVGSTSVILEQSASGHERNKASGMYFSGFIESAGREGARVLGDQNRIGGIISQSGQDFASSTAFRRGVRFRKGTDMTAAGENLVDAFIIDPNNVPFTHRAIGADADVDRANLIRATFANPETSAAVVDSTASLRYGVGGGFRANYAVEQNVLSGTFAIDSTGIKTVTIAHGLPVTPTIGQIQLTVTEDTDTDAWTYGFVKVESVDATNVTAKVYVTSTAPAAATAKLAMYARTT